MEFLWLCERPNSALRGFPRRERGTRRQPVRDGLTLDWNGLSMVRSPLEFFLLLPGQLGLRGIGA